MKLIDLERRLARIEGCRSSAPPTRILTDAPLGDVAADMRAADALANWRSWVASGRASVSNGVLVILSPEIPPEQRAERHVTPL